MMRKLLIVTSFVAFALAAGACGDETPAEEHEHVCTDGAWKCEGAQYRVCAADEWGPATACPSGQACMEMDGGAMCM